MDEIHRTPALHGSFSSTQPGVEKATLSSLLFPSTLCGPFSLFLFLHSASISCTPEFSMFGQLLLDFIHFLFLVSPWCRRYHPDVIISSQKPSPMFLRHCDPFHWALPFAVCFSFIKRIFSQYIGYIIHFPRQCVHLFSKC